MHHAIALPDLHKLDPDTRVRIENAVLEIFSTREFHRIGLIEIARGACVSLQTIYKYYGSKEALLFSGLDSRLGQLADELVPHLRRGADESGEQYRSRVREVFRATLDFFERNPKVMQIIMSSVYLNTWRQSAGYRNRELFGAIMDMLAHGRECGLLNATVSDKVLLDFFTGVTFRLVQSYIARGMAEPMLPQADTMFEMLWRAIAAPVR